MENELSTPNDSRTDLPGRVDPIHMLQFVQGLILQDAEGQGPQRESARPDEHEAGISPVARAAQLRWSALNRAFGDARLDLWTGRHGARQFRVPVALIAAAGVAPLTVASDEELQFDIPALLDATLQYCEPGGTA